MDAWRDGWHRLTRKLKFKTTSIGIGKIEGRVTSNINKEHGEADTLVIAGGNKIVQALWKPGCGVLKYA